MTVDIYITLRLQHQHFLYVSFQLLVSLPQTSAGEVPLWTPMRDFRPQTSVMVLLMNLRRSH